MLVTIDHFWHTDYWKGLRPEQLYLVYEFPVFKEEHCEAHLNTPTAEDINWINAVSHIERNYCCKKLFRENYTLLIEYIISGFFYPLTAHTCCVQFRKAAQS
jgi:hypothetical protein